MNIITPRELAELRKVPSVQPSVTALQASFTPVFDELLSLLTQHVSTLSDGLNERKEKPCKS